MNIHAFIHTKQNILAYINTYIHTWYAQTYVAPHSILKCCFQFILHIQYLHSHVCTHVLLPIHPETLPSAHIMWHTHTCTHSGTHHTQTFKPARAYTQSCAWIVRTCYTRGSRIGLPTSGKAVWLQSGPSQHTGMALEALVWTRFIQLHKGHFVHSWLISSTSYGLWSSVPKG